MGATGIDLMLERFHHRSGILVGPVIKRGNNYLATETPTARCRRKLWHSGPNSPRSSSNNTC